MLKGKLALLILLLVGLAACLKDQPSFNQDIATIVFENCTPCHRAAGPAPFSLTTYNQVFRKKKTIVKVIKQGIMPPWPANRSYTHFLGEKYLTQQEKELIYTWVKSGAKEGEGSPPPVPKFSSVSRIGEPDTTFWFDSVLVKGENRDKFYILTLPMELEGERFVKAIEFVPNKNKLVHHMNGHLLNYNTDQKVDIHSGRRIMDIEMDEKEYLAAFDSLMLYNDDGSKPERIHSAVNYLPGVEASIYPEGIGGFTIKPKSILVANDMHYAPIVKDKWDHSHVNLFFSDSPPKRPLQESMMGTNGISRIVPPLRIPPNQITRHVSSLEVEEDISVLTINPHMHLLGKSFKSYAIDPKGDTIRMIHIPKWDFRWQYFYTFPKMLKIPAGSTIYVEAEFDNTTNNPNNPNSPPMEVAERLDRGGEGMRTTDEMLQYIITWLPYEEGDEDISLKVD